TEPRLARLFERTDPALGDRLTNSIELGAGPGVSPVDQFLRAETVALGQRAAAGVRAWPVLRHGVALAGALTFLAIVAWFAFVGLAPEVFHAVLPRFLDPRGDHPPYSRLHFDVTPRQGDVLYGGQFEI